MSLAQWRSCAGMLWLAAVCPALGWGQLPPAESVQTLNLADGYEVKVFAAEPMIVNPIAIDVDTYGRVWVTEGVNYRRNVANPPDNKIKVLEDTDGDGVADKMTVFTSDLNAAMGVCVAGTKIYVPESPNLYVYEDKDNNLQPDGPRKTLLEGFGGKNHDHGVHSQVFGPDHKLYMTNGDTGYNVTGPDGKHIEFKWGAMIRCEADGTQLEDIAINFRNPFELAVDSFGHVWCSDNDNDGLKSVRICWILEGGNYGWFGRPEMIRNPDGSFDPINHWRANVPGFVPYVAITGFGSPCGMTFYEGTAFPGLRGSILHCDAGPRELRKYEPTKLATVGYGAGISNVMTGTSDNYYRPVDPCVAPDGSILVTDWYDGGVGGHAYNDPTRGRIYRLTPKGAKLSRKEKPGPYANDADALAALESPNHATTYLARERLLASGAAAIPALQKMADGDDAILAARALWLLDRIGGKGRDIVKSRLASKDGMTRGLAVRILRRHGDEYAADLLALADDKDSEVLCELILFLGKSKASGALPTLIKLFDRYDGSDRYLLEALGIAARSHVDEVFKAVVEKPGVEVSPRLVSIVRILRPEGATEYLTAKLKSTNLPAEARTALLAALSSSSSPDAGKNLAGLLSQDAPVAVKRLALESLKRNLNGPWSSLKTDESVLAGLGKALSNPELAAETLQVVGASGLTTFSKPVVALLADAKTPRPVQLAAISAVSTLQLADAAPALATMLKNPELREPALAALVSLRDAKTLTELLTGKDGAELKTSAVDQLVRSNDGALLLLRLIDTKKLDKPLADRTIAAAVEHPDVNVRLLYEKFIPVDQRPKTLGQAFKAEDILKLEGDVARGQAVFLRSGAAACNKCHRVKGQGADIGPDLSQIGRKYERGALLDAILNPSKGIAPEYVPHVVETSNGRVFAGFVQEQSNDGISLKTIEGLVVRIPQGDIEEIVKQTVSLMPELVLKNVTAQDASDLLAYLVSLQAAEVPATSFRALGPFPADRKAEYGPEKTADKFDAGAKFKGSGGKEVGWTTVQATSGQGGPQIDLAQAAKTIGGPAEQVVYFFAVTLDSSVAQAGTLHVGSDDGIQIWLNGTKVHDLSAQRALKPGEDKVQVNLKQGKNLILLKLDQGSGAGGLSLSAEAKGNLSFGTP